MDRKVSHGHSRQREKHVHRFFLPEILINWTGMGSRRFGFVCFFKNCLCYSVVEISWTRADVF